MPTPPYIIIAERCTDLHESGHRSTIVGSACREIRLNRCIDDPHDTVVRLRIAFKILYLQILITLLLEQLYGGVEHCLAFAHNRFR